MGHRELEEAFQDYLGKGSREEKKTGDEAVVESLKRALEATTPGSPGRAQDVRKEKPKKVSEWI